MTSLAEMVTSTVTAPAGMVIDMPAMPSSELVYSRVAFDTNMIAEPVAEPLVTVTVRLPKEPRVILPVQAPAVKAEGSRLVGAMEPVSTDRVVVPEIELTVLLEESLPVTVMLKAQPAMAEAGAVTLKWSKATTA